MRGKPQGWAPLWRRTGLVLIVLVAGALRFDGMRWDDGILAHPDERFMTMVASAVHGGRLAPTDRDEPARASHLAACAARHPATGGVGGWFDTACSDFNPANVGHAGYAYGELPLAAARIAAEAVSMWSGSSAHREYGGIQVVGRALSAGADLLTLLLTFLLGRMLWGRGVGGLAAAFYAVAVLPIQVSHFFTVDSAATMFATASLLFSVRLVRFGQRLDAVAFGAACGLALASKASVAPLIMLLPLAAWWAPRRVEFSRPPDLLVRIAVRLPEILLGCASAFVTFRIASPYAFAGPSWLNIGLAQSFLAQVEESRRLASGSVDIPPNWQWLGRTPWLWAGQNLLLWGLGLALGVAAVAGCARRGWRALRGTPIERARALPWIWAVAYFFWMGQQWVASMRYLMPIYPALCLFAAAWLVPWWRARRIGGPHRAGVSRAGRARWPAAIALGVLGATAVWALAFHQVHRTLHPYVAATNWVVRNIPGPVSAPLTTGQRTAVLVNWPAAGEYGDGLPARVAAGTVAPASGTVDRLRFRRIVTAEDGRASVLVARILDAGGTQLATTGAVQLPRGAGAEREIADLEVPLRTPLAVDGGRTYRLQLDVSGGTVAISGSRIATEGAWNDTVPWRSPRLPPSDILDLAGPSGSVARGAAVVDPFGEGYYVSLDLAMAAEDDAAKRDRLVAALDRAEWVILPNNRFFDSMPRNPLRFPLATRFYDALFAGELGFSRQLEVASFPNIAGIVIPDQSLPHDGLDRGAWSRWAAEEAFSVYDHPTVHVFRKTTGYSRAAVLRALSPLELTSVDAALRADKPAGAGRIAWSTLTASVAPDGLLRRADEAVAADRDATPPRAGARPGGAGSTTFAVVGWYGLSLLLGWLAWPWLALLWPGLPDRGYGIARIAGLATMAAIAWWLTWLGLPAWSRSGLALLLAALVITAWPVARRCLTLEPGLLRAHRPYIIGIEAVFGVLFALGLALRALDPDLWAPALGGEKAMDYAFFNSVLATASFPPLDPWFSGGRINYYYFGWVLAGVPTKLLGTPPAFAYNLALPLLFAMTGVGVLSLAWNACAGEHATPARLRWLAGSVALIAAVVLGNLDLPRALDANVKAVAALVDRVGPADAAAWKEALTQRSERWFWAPSRTVGERPGASFEINEFPAFTFLYGDLHPHLMAWPLQLFVLTAVLVLALPTRRTRAPPRTGIAAPLPQIMAAGCGVALLRATNTWDWPLYLLLACVATAIAGWREADAHVAPLPARFRRNRRLGLAALLVAALVVAQALVALPFTTSFATGALTLRWFDGVRTPLGTWLAVQGWFVLVIVGWAAMLAREPWTAPAGANARVVLRGLRLVRWSGVAYTLLAAAVAASRGSSADVPAVGAQAALVAWLIELLWRNAHRRPRAAGLAAAGAGFALALLVEFVVVGQDLGRMNTFFKVYLQSWILLSVASGLAIADLAAFGVPHRRWRLYGVSLAVASALALAYVPLAVYGRAQTRFDAALPLTLDGEAFLATAIYEVGGQRLRLADDHRLMRWLRANTGRDDVILEAQLPEYRWGSRLSSFTGRPTILGYRFHESQQRGVAGLGDAVELRRQNIAAIYATTDRRAALHALRHYGVRYVVVGGLERAKYPAAGLAKFRAMSVGGGLEAAFVSGEDVVYRVTGDPAADAGSGPRW